MQRGALIAGLFLIAGIAGCLDDGNESETATEAMAFEALIDLREPVVTAASFTQHVVDAAVDLTGDLYEPNVEVSDTGVIYISGHTIAVDTTGAPVFVSHDDGTTWSQLPWFQTLTMPEPVHGATPPVSDEIYLVAGDNGWLYGVDITLATYPVNAWADDGARHAYFNPDAYDEAQGLLTRAGIGCNSLSLNDRPWAAYANGTLLMVNNPGGGPIQVGAMEVPMNLPVGTPGIGDLAPPKWNLCASPGGGIPGIPDIRDDGFFAVPQTESTDGGRLIIVTGNQDNVMDVDYHVVFNNTHSSASGVLNSGHVVFDDEGTLFVGIMNNTAEDDDGERYGHFQIGVSHDGETFQKVRFATGPVVQNIFLDANLNGPGVLLVWAIAGDEAGRSDWYTAHLYATETGMPYLENIVLAIDEGSPPSAHLTTAAVGPDGRAYISAYESVAPGGTPLSVWVQQDGPTLPVA